jgi:DNA-binding MarR family transcriptional regulator
MDRKAACKEIMELFIRVVNKYNSLEKIPVRYGTKQNLFHSERHMLDIMGDNPGMNMTEFAAAAGVTKGAISQLVIKLEKKGVVKRYKRSGNDKEVMISLTDAGKEIYKKHKKINEDTMMPLFKKLDNYPDEKIHFLVTMFKWFDEFMDYSREKMQEHKNQGC